MTDKSRKKVEKNTSKTKNSPVEKKVDDSLNLIKQENKELKRKISELEKINSELEKEKEESQKANILKSQFLASMSHELRSPLNAIYGYISFLKKMHYNQYDFLFEHIELCQKHLMETLRKIIILSQLQTNTFPYHPTICNIPKILSDSLLTIEILALQKGLAITVNCEEANIYCNADPYALTHAFTNIIDNAIKYTEKFKGHIMASVSRNKKGEIIIEFTDKGIGISEDQIPYLFDEFSNEIASFKRRTEGSGIGMPLTKRLVEACGGKISVASKKNVGTTVTIILPEVKIKKSNKDSYEEIREPEAPNIEGMVNILVAEKDPITMQYFQLNLKQYNYNIYKAFTLEQIKSILENYKMDLLIMDISVQPDFENDFINLRKDKILGKTPVIILGEPEQLKTKKEFIEKFNCFITMPVSMPKLTAQIKRILDK